MSFATRALHTLALALLTGLSWPVAAQTQTPFTGMPIALPGTIEAEKFDNGGEGVAYHDNVAGNAGGQYRTNESVDIIVSRDTTFPGYVVTNFETGEWLEYTVDIQAAGQYEIALRVASGTFTGAFHVEIDDNNVTGRVVVPPTGNFGTFTWVAKKGVSLPAGRHVLKLVSEQQYFDVNQIRVTATPTTPYAGVIPLPGMIEAENYDNGGPDISYNDTTAMNDGGQFRTDGVDIIASRDPDDAGAGFGVNGFHAGEWLVYTVNVAGTRLYDIEARVATGTFANAAFHIEIDGVNVTGSMVPGATGNFGTYVWFKKPSVWLTAGQHVLKLVSDQEIADVNRIRVTAVTHTPYSGAPVNGTPIALPGTFEAEDFDEGGEGNAYHDMTATNVSGQYRPNEGVDIKVSPDSGGGAYVVNNFQSGEWLAYTVNIAEAREYDIELRMASGATTSARFHVEIDDQDLTGSVAVPATGNFGAYQWFGKKNVPLPAGRHTLKIVSDQEYIDINSIRVVASTTQAENHPNLLFRSGFEGISLTPIVSDSDCDDANCYQDLVGRDSATGFAWPPQTPATSTSRFKLRAGGGIQLNPDFFSKPKPDTISNWIVNGIETVPGRKPNTSTRAQYSEIKQNCFGRTGGQENCSTQDTYQGAGGHPTSELPDMYISFWRRLQPELMNKLAAAGEPWHVVFEWKTTSDRRVIAQIVRWEKDQLPYWQISSNPDGGGGDELWRCPFFRHTTTPDPACKAGVARIPSFGGWFKFEVFWHRSTGDDGRVWMAVNGTKIVDRRGPNKASNLIDRIMFMQLYSGVAYPVYQWTDDVQIWSKVPVEGVDAKPGDPWYDPPYGLK